MTYCITGEKKEGLTFKMKKATTPMAFAIRAIRKPNIPITWRPIVKLNIENSQEEEVAH